MRFQASEVVESPDVELVSRALETNLRAQWAEVGREGDTIVLRGLGPTHRVNRNDRAVFSVKAADGGRTAIEVDATYLASALIGTGAPQNEIVQRKLDGVLEMVRMDVDLAERRAALEKQNGHKPVLVSTNAASHAASAVVVPDAVEQAAATTVVEHEPETRIEPAARIEPASEVVLPEVQEASPAEPVVARESASEVREPVPPAGDTLQKVLERMAQREGAESSAVKGQDKEQDDGAEGDVLSLHRDGTMPGAEKTSAASPQPPVEEQHLIHRGDVAAEGTESEPRKERSAGPIFAVLLVTFLLAAATQVGWEYRAQISPRIAALRASLRADWSDGHSEQSQSSPSGPTPEQQAARQQAEQAAAAANAEKAAEAARLAEPDPKQWLENWATTMKGTDAGAQAAYYADPVEKYFLRYNVSRAEIMAARQDEIARRKGTWTMRLDDVVVAQQTDTAARVLFVKYIASDDEGAGVVEQRLPTQIRLKRVDGQWRIVSEQTLG